MRQGDLLLTTDEHVAITKLIRPREDGTIPPGFVTLIITAEDRLARYRDGVARVLYPVPGGEEELCVASVHTCPVAKDPPPANTMLSRHCFQGQELEWWIILPGGKIMFILPDEPLRPGHDVVAVFEILDARRPAMPQLLVPYTAKTMDVSIHGVH